jgi:hypothetical protein
VRRRNGRVRPDAQCEAEVAVVKRARDEAVHSLGRIRDMSERPLCVCGRATGTAAIKACATTALARIDAEDAKP